jgi:predicted O-methyltransferase YrrM
MDKKVLAVLDAYHERMREEDQRMQEVMRMGGPGSSGMLDQVLLSVGPDTGQLLNILVRSLKAPHILELGTSYGYSGIWLAEAARETGGRVTTTELQDYKVAYAREKAEQAGLAGFIDYKVGDALKTIAELPFKLDFVLVDLWKNLYEPCLEAFYPKLNPGAIIVADNMLRPGGEEVQRYGRAVRAKPGITSILLPVGSGLEISRFEPS